jgi:hypothetical protein
MSEVCTTGNPSRVERCSASFCGSCAGFSGPSFAIMTTNALLLLICEPYGLFQQGQVSGKTRLICSVPVPGGATRFNAGPVCSEHDSNRMRLSSGRLAHDRNRLKPWARPGVRISVMSLPRVTAGSGIQDAEVSMTHKVEGRRICR